MSDNFKYLSFDGLKELNKRVTDILEGLDNMCPEGWVENPDNYEILDFYETQYSDRMYSSRMRVQPKTSRVIEIKYPYYECDFIKLEAADGSSSYLEAAKSEYTKSFFLVRKDYRDLPEHHYHKIVYETLSKIKNMIENDVSVYTLSMELTASLEFLEELGDSWKDGLVEVDTDHWMEQLKPIVLDREGVHEGVEKYIEDSKKRAIEFYNKEKGKYKQEPQPDPDDYTTPLPVNYHKISTYLLIPLTFVMLVLLVAG